MGPSTIWDEIRGFIGGIAFRIFIWSLRCTKEQYWEEVWRIEQSLKDGVDHADMPTADFIEARIHARNAARAARNFAEADAIRDELVALGVELEDTRDGTRWKLLSAKDAEIERLRAELKKHRWIPVEERLPEPWTQVVVWSDESQEPWLAEYGRDIWRRFRSGDRIDGATHWRYINPPNDG